MKHRPTWMPHSALLALACLCLSTLLASCSLDAGQTFTIVSGSENQVLEPIVAEFCKARGATCKVTYKGSLDIGLGLKPGGDLDADAVWPAASIWIDVFDTGRRVKSLKSIAQMPVILGLRRSKAQDLGWIGKPVTNLDILAAVSDKKLKFLMSSATQSNSGSSAYLAMLAAAVGKPDLIEPADLDDQNVLSRVRQFLKGVERSAGSSGWLAELYRNGEANGRPYEGMWNYEAVILETNQALLAEHREPLYAIYPEDGVALADSPLGFVDRGRGADVESFFDALQSHLLSPDIQKRIAATGRRIAFSSVDRPKPDPGTNLDPGRPIHVIRTPEPETIQKALQLYQEALRRPSLTALCLDFSGSMANNGGADRLRDAMSFLLTPASTRDFLVQWTKDDAVFLLPFDEAVRWVEEGSGSGPDQQRLLAKVETVQADDATDFYNCGARAIDEMQAVLRKGEHLPAIVIMTDGMSQGTVETFQRRWEADGRRIPVFGITFGKDADRSQLDNLARLTGGRVFDGTQSLIEAFRAVRGYN